MIHKKSTPYYPQANGLAKSTKKTLQKKQAQHQPDRLNKPRAGSAHMGVVKIFGNGVKIAWNGQNREGAMCTLHAYISMLSETCARVMCAHHTNT